MAERDGIDSSTKLIQWEVARRKTFILFCYFTSVLGAEYSIITPNLLGYLREEIKVEKENYKRAGWFGVIVSSYWLTSMLGNIFIAR